MSQHAWTPTPEVVARSNVKRFMDAHGFASYEELAARSLRDVPWFWGVIEKELGIHWFEPYERVLDLTAGKPWAKWFVGGKLNLAHQCVDLQAERHPERVALIGEAEDGAVRRLTYAELKGEVDRLCRALRQLGVGRGDRVGIFLPMVPENVVAFMAVAKLGAILTPIFSGFGASAVAARLNDCEAKLLVTADGFHRKGAHVDMKAVADEAAAACPALERVLVFRHTGAPVPWTQERDVWKIPS